MFSIDLNQTNTVVLRRIFFENKLKKQITIQLGLRNIFIFNINFFILSFLINEIKSIQNMLCNIKLIYALVPMDK